MDQVQQRFQKIFSSLTSQINSDIEKLADGQMKLSLPRISADDLTQICMYAEKLFMSEQVLIRIQSPVVVVGDLHGHYLDILRILKHIGLPICQNVVFLGDLVDRGEFSIETVSLVFLLKIMFPNYVTIIRGNHEFAFLCERCGFVGELVAAYPNNQNVKHNFFSAFSQIPLCALIDGSYLCVHGGIGPSWFSLEQLYSNQRPINEYDDGLLDTILWSDPSEETEFYESSNRGTGYLFGKTALNEFLNANNISVIIRGHECVDEGCKFMFDEKLVTVFSASNYCGLVGNEAAVLEIEPNGQMRSTKFSSLNYLKRSSVVFGQETNLQFTKLNQSQNMTITSPLKVPLVIRPKFSLSASHEIHKKNSLLKGNEPKFLASSRNMVSTSVDLKKNNNLTTRSPLVRIIGHMY